MKIPAIKGFIESITPVKQLKKGFSQGVVIHVEAVKNEDGDILRKEHYYLVNVWSNKSDDSRFIPETAKGMLCKAECYLDGERWQGKYGWEYNNKIKLDKWVEEDEKTKL
jgi:hypothetical protein